MFLDILFATTAGVTGADEFGVILEAGRDRFATVGIPLYEFDHLCFFFVRSPFLEGGDVGEDESVAIVGVAGAVGRTCGRRFGGCRCGRGLDILSIRLRLVLLQMWRQRLGHGQLPESEMLETHTFCQGIRSKKVSCKPLPKKKFGSFLCHTRYLSRVAV